MHVEIARSHNSIADFAITVILLRIICYLCMPILGYGTWRAVRERLAGRETVTRMIVLVLLHVVPLICMLLLLSSLSIHPS
ncbi:MAG TPA: hypothetical protein PKM25_15625 [Candidatus Ozemobacteraceae bacterium]|nr:hypothetical protein [Candidatus Ozemobacteraceae bacterium]